MWPLSYSESVSCTMISNRQCYGRGYSRRSGGSRNGGSLESRHGIDTDHPVIDSCKAVYAMRVHTAPATIGKAYFIEHSNNSPKTNPRLEGSAESQTDARGWLSYRGPTQQIHSRHDCEGC